MCGVAAPVLEAVNGLYSELCGGFYMKYLGLSRLGVCGVAVLLLGAFAIARTPEGGYHLLKKYELGPAPGGKEYWDYIIFDASTRHLYISHNTEVKVVDADSGAIVGSIPDLKRVHGIALVPDLGRGFISDGGADEAVVFDLKNLKVTGHIKTGANPDCILYDPASKHIFTMNGKSNDASVIDPAAETVVATIPMGARPEYAVADGKGMIYDNIEDKDEIVALDSRTNTVRARWPIAPSGGATAMEMDVQHRRLFIGGRPQTVAATDAYNGEGFPPIPICGAWSTNNSSTQHSLGFST